MRRKFGVFFMILGTALIFGALSLFLWNRHEEQQAGEFTVDIMPAIVEEIQQVQEAAPSEPDLTGNIPVELLTEEDLVMTERTIKGYPYIGYLSIPDLMLQLPIMSDWTYQRLRVSPCRYSGTLKGEDLVLLAHSYNAHFGRLSTLTEGSEIQFTDMEGNIWRYEVVLMDILNPTDVEEMTAGEYDLTLFSCTKTGKQRVTVRCNLIR